MKNLPITWRLNIGLAIFAGLGFGGMILNWWIAKEQLTRKYATQDREFRILRLANEILDTQSRRELFIQEQVFSPGSSSPATTEGYLQMLQRPDPLGERLEDEAELRVDLDKLKRQIYPELNRLEGDLIKLSLDGTNPKRAQQLYLNEYKTARAQLSDTLKTLQGRAQQPVRGNGTGLFTAEAFLVIVGLLFVTWTTAMLRHNLVAFKEPVGELRSALDRVGDGDFTINVQLKRKDEFADLANGIINMTRKLAVMIGRLHQNAEVVTQSARSILTAAAQQQKAVEEIAHVGEFLSDAGRKIHFSAVQLGGTINIVGQASESAARFGSDSDETLDQLGASIGDIKDSAEAINSKLEILSEKAGDINQVVVTMSKMADRTNLLSINAAIEAEKAGDAGKGFAVVANEIQNLADLTAAATEDIEQMVKGIQKAVAAGVIGTEQFDNEVRTGAERLETLTETVNGINRQIETLRPQVEVINAHMHTQSDGARQLQNRTNSFTQSMKSAAESLQTVKVAADQLEHAARDLEEGMERFNLNS